jgi:hypothetical protein
MKKILFFCVAFFSCISQMFALDARWSDIELSAQYNSSSQQLIFDFELFVNSDPNENYVLFLESEDQSCEMNLEYKSFYLRGECAIAVAESELIGNYSLDFKIFDEGDTLVYSRNNYTLNVENLFDSFAWDRFVSSSQYNPESEKLFVTLSLPYLPQAPYHQYEMFLEYKQRGYWQALSYDASTQSLLAHYSFDIPQEDILSSYMLKYEIVNINFSQKDEEDLYEVFDGRVSMSVVMQEPVISDAQKVAIKRILSNYAEKLFRANPKDPSLRHLESIQEAFRTYGLSHPEKVAICEYVIEVIQDIIVERR